MRIGAAVCACAEMLFTNLQEHWAPLNVKKYLHGFLCKYKWGESTENINQIEMSVSEILNIGSAAAGVTSVQLNFVKYEKATIWMGYAYDIGRSGDLGHDASKKVAIWIGYIYMK